MAFSLNSNRNGYYAAYPYGFNGVLDYSFGALSLSSNLGSRVVPVIGYPYSPLNWNGTGVSDQPQTSTSSARTGRVDHGIPTASRVNFLAQQSICNRYGQPSEIMHSVHDLEKLLTKATQFVNGRCSWYTVPYFYRDKTSKYFNNILRNEAGLMRVYPKDFHGDPKSPINGRLDGLFFSANVDPRTMAPSSQSIYGEKRLKVDVDVILELCPNLYFADFYCVSRPHYVTLVLTKSGSSADQFCRRHLVKLSWQDNPFLKLSEKARSRKVLRVRQSGDFWIELMVTENLNISDQSFQNVIMVGRRSGGRLGLKKNASCHFCNINTPATFFNPFLFN